MLYLVFDTYTNAESADQIITQNMGLGDGVTQRWAEVRQRLDGKYVIPKPEERYMTGVAGYVEEEYQDSWFYTDGE